jgi:hypothetical protein
MLVIYFNTFLVEFESIEGLLFILEQNELTEIEQLLATISIEEYDNDDPPCQYLTEFGEMDSIKAVIFLNNQSILYTITKIDIFN